MRSFYTMRGFSSAIPPLLEKRAQIKMADVDPRAFLALLAGGGIGYAAHKATLDREKKLRNAAVAALLGTGLGYGLASAAFPHRPSTEILDTGLSGLSSKASGGVE